VEVEAADGVEGAVAARWGKAGRVWKVGVLRREWVRSVWEKRGNEGKRWDALGGGSAGLGAPCAAWWEQKKVGLY
jgi:hypothetical protein